MKRLICALGVLLVLALPLTAQLSTSAILGTVRDASGAVIPGAKITATNQGTNVTRTTESDNAGLYRIDALPPGQYNITIEKQGFSTESLKSLTLTVAQNAEANAALKVGAVSDTVQVEADASPQVNVTSSSLGGLVNSQQVAELPLNGRNFIDLALLQPGISNATSSGPGVVKNATYFSTNGAPLRSNLVTLDGAPEMNLTGTTSSAIGTTLGVDGIQEFRVISNAFGAQYGISMGSQIIIASKGGTNQFHGDAFDYLRNQMFDASGYFAASKPKLIKNNFGGSFGGPIVKDKTFFYAVYEGFRLLQGVPTNINTLPDNCNPNVGGAALLITNPCATDSPTHAVNQAMVPFIKWFPASNVSGASKYQTNGSQPTNDDYGQIRVDQTFSASDSIFGRFTIDKSNQASLTSFPGTEYQGVGSTTLGSDQFDTVAWNHVISPTLLNTYRASYSRTLIQNNPAAPASFANYHLVYNQGMGSIAVSSLGTTLGPQGNAPQGFNENSYNTSDDLNWTKGRHAIQTGVLLNRIEYYTYNANTLRGNWTSLTTADMMNGTYSTFQALLPGTIFAREPRFYTAGFYVQDDWRFNSRLTLNLGARYEFNTSSINRNGANYAFLNLSDPAPTYGQNMRNASFKNIEPRIGFAWDVFGNGKTSIRAAGGVYDDVNAAGEAFYGASPGTPPLAAGLALSSGTISSLPIATAANNLTPGTVPYGQAIKTIDFNAHQPRMEQWNFSIQQQVTPTTTITLAYVGTNGQNLWDYEEGNPCTPSMVVNGIPSWTPPNVVAPANSSGANPAGQLLGINSKYASVICNDVVGQGTSSAKLLTATYPTNATFPGQYNVPNRTNPVWGDWILAATNGYSRYNGGQLTVAQRVTHGLSGQLAYTYSKVLDEAQGTHSSTECTTSGGNPSVPFQPARHIFNYGPACFDVPQSLQVSIIYHLPKTEAGGFVGRDILSGWWLGSKDAWQTGFAFSPTSNTWRSLDQNMNQQAADASSEYVNYGTNTVVPGSIGPDGTINTTGSTFIPFDKNRVIVNKKIPGAVSWFNPLMFTMNPLGQLGTVRKNVLRGPHYSDIDLSLNKDTPLPGLGEKGSLEFRAEVFNLFNHTNFNLPTGYKTFTGSLTDIGEYSENPIGTAGEITTTIPNNWRQMQFSLKVLF